MKVYLKGLNTCTQRAGKIQQYREFLLGNGHQVTEALEGSDAVLVWTCAFRGDVRDNSLAQLEAFAETGARVVATGCMPDIDPETLAESFDGTVIPWNDEQRLEDLFLRPGGRRLEECEWVFSAPAVCDDLAAYRRAHPEADVTFPDQFLKLVISEGCPFQCTYCSERLAFPDYRSTPPDVLLERCRSLLDGAPRKEVILLGDCVGEYGRDIDTDLPTLLQRLLGLDPELRIALGNFHPINFIRAFGAFAPLIRSGRIRHLNLPIQSASDRLLRRMARVYTKADLDRMFSFFRDVGFDQFDTHILVGFPGETEEDFMETVEFLIGHRLRYVLVSRYMETAAMASARLDGKVGPEEVGQRMARARALLEDAGAIVNSEDSHLMRERIERLNRGSKCY